MSLPRVKLPGGSPDTWMEPHSFPGPRGPLALPPSKLPAATAWPPDPPLNAQLLTSRPLGSLRPLLGHSAPRGSEASSPRPLCHITSYLLPLSPCHFLAQCPTPPLGTCPPGKGGPCASSPHSRLACRGGTQNTCSGNVRSMKVMLDLAQKVSVPSCGCSAHFRKDREEEDRKRPSRGGQASGRPPDPPSSRLLGGPFLQEVFEMLFICDSGYRRVGL